MSGTSNKIIGLSIWLSISNWLGNRGAKAWQQFVDLA